MIALPKAKEFGYPLAFIFIFFGIGCSLAASDYLLITMSGKGLGSHLILGMFVGSIGGALMITIRAISEDLANSLGAIASKTVKGFAEICSKMFLGFAKSRFARGISIAFGSDTSKDKDSDE